MLYKIFYQKSYKSQQQNITTQCHKIKTNKDLIENIY